MSGTIRHLWPEGHDAHLDARVARAWEAYGEALDLVRDMLRGTSGWVDEPTLASGLTDELRAYLDAALHVVAAEPEWCWRFQYDAVRREVVDDAGSTRAEYAWVDWSGPFLPTVLAPYVTGREVAG